MALLRRWHSRISHSSDLQDGARLSGSRRHSRLHALLIVVLLGLLLLPNGAANAQAISAPMPPSGPRPGTGTTSDCTRDVHQGILASGPPYTILNVNNLTQPIAPASGVTGISFVDTSGGDVTLNADTAGTAGILITGGAFAGIIVSSSSSATTGAVTVNSTGSIATDGIVGISASGEA